MGAARLVVPSLLSLVVLALMTNGISSAGSKDLGNGFMDHGVCTPLSNHRGIVATEDGAGRDIVLAWLMDHRGCYELLLVDAETGKSEEFPIPAPTGGDAPYASILSSGNKLFTHFGSHFYEFDPAQRKFSFIHETAPQMAMGMTEDDHGVIWSVSYPQSGVVSYDPKTGEFKDHGHVYKQNWAQYQRYVAADDAGWLYFGIGSTASQIIAFDPATGTVRPLLAEAERLPAASGVVYRDMNGKVYGSNGSAPDKWMELYQGVRTDLAQAPAVKKKPIITSSQGLFHQQFPDGKVLKVFDTIERRLVVEDPQTKQTHELSFEYQSEGAHIMGMCAAPDGTMCGGSAFPFRFFSYNPKTDEWVRHKAFLQFNTVVRQGDRWYTGGYGEGFLLEWDPAKPWVDTVKDKPDCNPLFLAEAFPDINRPHDLLAHPDGKTLVLAGTPGYGLTGGGLMFWDRETKKAQVLKHTQLLPDHAPMSLVALPEGRLLVGTTIEPGTGGAVKAKVAELLIMDMASKQVEWHAPLLPEVRSYTDMCPGPSGLVFGFADCRRFFVFDPKTRAIVTERNIQAELGPTNSGQQTRTFVFGPEGATYVLLRKGIGKLDPQTFAITLLAESPAPIGSGGNWLDGRIYFAGGSHMYSWAVPR
jgi:streptogramin lyase